MKSEKVTFKYLREPTATDRMQMIDSFRYMDYAMIVYGWVQPSNSRYYGISKFVKWFLLFSAFYLPVGLSITYWKEISTFTSGELFSSLQAALNSPGAFIKGVVSVLTVWRLTIFKDKLEQMNKRCVKEEEQLAVHRTAKLCNIVYLAYLVLYASFFILTILTAVLRGHTPWRIYNPYFDWRTSTFSLLMATLFEVLFMGTGLFYNQVNDSYPLLIGMVIRLNMDLLKNRIENLRTDPNKSEEQNYEDLKGCINDHSQILEICDIMRPTLSGFIFVQFLCVGILFGLTMINLMYFATFWTGISSAAYLFDLVIQTFPFCYCCTLIDSDCDELAFSIFHSNWIDAPPRYKSALRHFLHNIQQNITFTAGAIFPISLHTNITVAKFAFTVVAFVKQMNIIDKLTNM